MTTFQCRYCHSTVLLQETINGSCIRCESINSLVALGNRLVEVARHVERTSSLPSAAKVLHQARVTLAEIETHMLQANSK